MAKNHRGTGVRTLPSRGRGECPRCHTTGIKLVYEVEIDGKKVKVCKVCNGALKNIARREVPVKQEAAPAAETPAEPAAQEPQVEQADAQ